MKKLILTSALLLMFTVGVSAQNRSIEFEETKVWKEIVAKAKSENKLIFVDCYTDWCGPCKTLALNVFTKDEVADFFNENFINAKFEMEKDADGVAHKDVWKISAFPTLIFVDPKTEKVVHRLVGAGKPEWLINGGKEAMDPSKNLNSLIERYENGERDPEFIGEYLKALKAAYMKEEQSIVAIEYLDNMTLDQLATQQGWLLIRENINDPLSKPVRTVMANRQNFYDIPDLGQATVDRLMSNMIINSATAISCWTPDYGEFDQARFDALVEYYKSIDDFPAVEPAMAWLETSELCRKGDWKKMIAKMKKVEKDNVLPGTISNQYFQFFVESLGRMDNEKAAREGVKLIDERIAQIEGNDTNAYFAKARLSNSKYRLLKSIGDELGADKAKMDEEEFAKTGKELSGGTMQPAMRMN